MNLHGRPSPSTWQPMAVHSAQLRPLAWEPSFTNLDGTLMIYPWRAAGTSGYPWGRLTWHYHEPLRPCINWHRCVNILPFLTILRKRPSLFMKCPCLVIAYDEAHYVVTALSLPFTVLGELLHDVTSDCDDTRWTPMELLWHCHKRFRHPPCSFIFLHELPQVGNNVLWRSIPFSWRCHQLSLLSLI